MRTLKTILNKFNISCLFYHKFIKEHREDKQGKFLFKRELKEERQN